MAVVQPGLDGIILPKVESAAGLATIDWLLAQLERDRGLPPADIDLIPIIETARGLQQIDAILAAGTRVRRVAFGAGDFTLDVNMTWSRSEAELAHARASIVTASRAAGIEAPLDTVWVDLTDPDGLEASARTALGYGFQGKMCIHPDQIAVVNRVFTPTDAEIAFAERVCAAFAQAEAEGSAAIQLDGKFIDYPIVYRAQRTLAADRRDPRAGGRVMTDKPAGPLDGIKVLDLCSYLAGPYGCTLLADLGADVIKIESPQGDMLRQFPSSLPGDSRFFIGTNRGKRALALDLKQTEGLAVLHRMVASADVLVENFRPSVPARLGIDYPRLRAINPRLIYAGLTGYGDTGPLSDKGGFDQVLQCLTGMAVFQGGGADTRATGAGFGARLLHLGAAGLWRRRRAVPARAQRRTGNISACRCCAAR